MQKAVHCGRLSILSVTSYIDLLSFGLFFIFNAPSMRNKRLNLYITKGDILLDLLLIAWVIVT